MIAYYRIMVQDALVAAALHQGYHIGWKICLSLGCMWFEIPPLYKTYCTYLINFLIKLASKLKTVHISGSNQKKWYTFLALLHVYTWKMHMRSLSRAHSASWWLILPKTDTSYLKLVIISKWTNSLFSRHSVSDTNMTLP